MPPVTPPEVLEPGSPAPYCEQVQCGKIKGRKRQDGSEAGGRSREEVMRVARNRLM